MSGALLVAGVVMVDPYTVISGASSKVEAAGRLHDHFQQAAGRLFRDGEVAISVAEDGYRSAFVGAVLQSLPGASPEVRPRRIRLTRRQDP